MTANEVEKNAVPYNDEHDYTRERLDGHERDVSEKQQDRFEGVRDAIFDAMLSGKLDETDIKIIHARDCSPMPSNRELSRRLKIHEATIRVRITHIKALMPKELRLKARHKLRSLPL